MTTSSITLLVLLGLLSLGFALPPGRTCGTAHPSHAVSTPGKAIPFCGYHECDDPDVRDLYLLQSDSPMINVSLNVVYFGVLDGADLTTYNSQLQFFKSQYEKQMNITWTITTTVVTNKYQVVDPADRTLHNQIAAEYYVPGSMTLLFSAFDPNPNFLLGYAYLPQSFTNLADDPAAWFTILDSTYAISPTGTTMLHEVGHMFGLFHTFTQECDDCSENINSPNLNIVGDFCSDTKPVWMSFTCNSLSEQDTDCNSQQYTNLATLPQDNFMAYTPDSCQDTFTSQQAARARCYLDRLINFVVIDQNTGVPSSSNTPSTGPASGGNTPIGTPIRTPAKSPSSKVVSTASQREGVLALFGLVLLAVAF